MNSSCHGRKQAADVRKHAGTGADARDPSPATMRSYMVAEIQAVVQKIQGVVLKPNYVYTLKHHPAESVNKRFFHCRPYIKRGRGNVESRHAMNINKRMVAYSNCCVAALLIDPASSKLVSLAVA